MPPATCTSTSFSAANGGGGGEIIIFGVRLVVDSMRKSVSMNNMSQYEQPREPNYNNKNKGTENVTSGYASADDVVPQSTGNCERKRGVPWTEDEHKLFLIGLQKIGKGDWRGISRNFVKTRTPTQVASHAQKYYLRRRGNLNRRRRRSSLFDITTDKVAVMSMEEEQFHAQEKTTQPVAFPMFVNPVVQSVPMNKMTLGQENKLIRPISLFPTPQPSDLDLNLNLNPLNDPSPLSLKLSLQLNEIDSSSSSRQSALQVQPNLNSGDSNSNTNNNSNSNSIINVA